MSLVGRLGYCLLGTAKIAVATASAGAALHNSQQDFCLGGVYSSMSSPSIHFNNELTVCSYTNAGSKFANFGADVFSSVTGQKPFTTFSIPISKINTLASGASALIFAISAIKDFGKAFAC
ncbi:MAG: hypothetical protein S4CHLAM6_12070 [Chlamydiae bacterium]|nr:hypothetical protein [Chlamydiota bacterium]